VEEYTVAVPQRIPARFEDVFPQGAYVLAVEAANDFEKVKAGLSDVQARDKTTGERVWTVRVLDVDPAARKAEVKVKMTGETPPSLPDMLPGTPFRPVVFDGLLVVPYVDTNGARPRQEFSLRASGMRPATMGRRPAVAA